MTKPDISFAATVVWEREHADFLDARYSRRHVWLFDGGSDIVASSSPHSVPIPYSDPAAVDPEEAFVASLSSCHMLWFLAIAAKRKFCVEHYIDHATGVMAKNALGKHFMSVVTLRPRVTFCDSPRDAPREAPSGSQGHSHVPTREDIMQLHHEAHSECYIANSVRTEVRCEPVL